MKPNTPVNYAHQDHCSLDRHDKIIDNINGYSYLLEGQFPKQAYQGKARGLGTPKLTLEQAKVDP